MKLSTRRDFIKKTAFTAGLMPFLSFPFSAFALEVPNDILSVHIFSKHLQFLDYKETGEIAAEMGFSGVDLTVRSKGHVLPEYVKTHLPKAIKAIKEGGSKCDMIATNIESIDNEVDVEILKTAAKSGVKYYRANWFKYPHSKSMPEALVMYQEQIRRLGDLNKELELIGCYQNHAGQNVGASFWELNKILETVDSNYFGLQYDIRHAMVEGYNSWENGLELLHSHVKTIVLKDYKWGRVNGKWQIINVPIGEGMINFDKYFKLLKQYKLNPPVSLHLEYDLGGAEKGNESISVDKKVVFDAMKKDLMTVQILWINA